MEGFLYLASLTHPEPHMAPVSVPGVKSLGIGGFKVKWLEIGGPSCRCP